MSVKCEICGKEFKTPQGLRGHKNFVHPDVLDQPTKPAAEREFTKVTERRWEILYISTD